MKMKRCLSVLLLLSLEAALLAAGHSSDAAVGSIRLPSDAAAAAATATAMVRPWNCCDAAICTKSIPPICNCADEVERCAAACKSCVPSELHPSLFVCEDQYVGDPGPICRPWTCCDRAPCTTSIPPICRCVDEVDQCAPTCESCEASTSDPSRRVCKDTFRGFPGPKCTPRCCLADLLD